MRFIHVRQRFDVSIGCHTAFGNRRSPLVRGLISPVFYVLPDQPCQLRPATALLWLKYSCPTNVAIGKPDSSLKLLLEFDCSLASMNTRICSRPISVFLLADQSPACRVSFSFRLILYETRLEFAHSPPYCYPMNAFVSERDPSGRPQTDQTSRK